jgi:flagellar hook protein FlgE
MSLTGALSSAITALNAQSQSLSMISDNISNADTTGYKTTSAMFEDLVTASSSSSSYSSGGVTVSGFANITQQGLLAATTTATNVAIQGSGFFVTTSAQTGGTTSYTRNGAFTTDNAGYLVNNGNYL